MEGIRDAKVNSNVKGTFVRILEYQEAAERQSISYPTGRPGGVEVTRRVPYTFQLMGASTISNWRRRASFVMAAAAVAAILLSTGGIIGCQGAGQPGTQSGPPAENASPAIQAAVPLSNDPEAARPEFYTNRVRPIFQANCSRCHAGMNRRGGLSMSTRAGMMKGGKDGPVVFPGDPAHSLLVLGIRHEGKPKPMPEKAAKLSDADIATVERWIRAGAVMPADVPVW